MALDLLKPLVEPHPQSNSDLLVGCFQSSYPALLGGIPALWAIMWTVFSVMQVLCTALKLKQGDAARGEIINQQVGCSMFLACGCSGRLESVTDVTLGTLKNHQSCIRFFSMCCLLLAQVAEVNYSSSSFLRFWSCTQCLLSGWPEPCIFLRSSFPSVSCSRAPQPSSLGLYT